MLLSFAQFEREVIAERIRDKVAASKAKGMWMGGSVPLVYEPKDRKLVVVPEEAATVRHIMERYLASESILTLAEELRRDGIVSKRRVSRSGGAYGGVPFKRGALAWLLSNRTYVGEVVHKGKVYPGEHEAIVSRELFDAVQAKLAERTARTEKNSTRRRVSLLAGMMRDDRGRPMSPCHTRNHGRRYSYYASNLSDDAGAAALRLPAGELEAAVRSALAGWLNDRHIIRGLVSGSGAHEQERVLAECSQLAERLGKAPVAEVRELLQQSEAQVLVSSTGASLAFKASAVLALANLEGNDQPITIEIPTAQAHYGHEPRLRLEPTGNGSIARNERLVEMLARSFAARDELLMMDEAQAAAIPTTRLRHLQRMARLAYLDPAVVRAILCGTQPAHLSARSLWRMRELPLSWSEQREMLQLL